MPKPQPNIAFAPGTLFLVGTLEGAKLDGHWLRPRLGPRYPTPDPGSGPGLDPTPNLDEDDEEEGMLACH